VILLVIAGSAATHWLGRGVALTFYRRLDPATAGTMGFLLRLLAMVAIVVLALRIAGITAATLAVGGAFTAILLGLAAQQTLGNLFAGIVLQSTRPFRVGERVRLVGGALAGSIEGTVSSLGLFYATLVRGADRLLVPNSVLLSLVVVPLREPDRVDVRARFDIDASPRRVEEKLRGSITVPTRYPPHVGLEEIDEDGVALRITATPCEPTTAPSSPRRFYPPCASRRSGLTRPARGSATLGRATIRSARGLAWSLSGKTKSKPTPRARGRVSS
jgi:small conductance mechanosensitive channel